MMRSVYLKTLYDKRYFIVGWVLGFMILSMLMTSFFPAFHDSSALGAFTKNLPKAFAGLIGNLGDLQSFPTYLASQLFDIRLPLIAGIMAIILGLSLSTNEEESGELRTLLALPISRTSLLLQKWLAMVTITLMATLGIVPGVYVILPFINDASIELSVLLRLIAVTWLLMVTYGSVTFAAGMALGKRGPANAIGVLVIIGSFILSTFGKSVDWLSDYEKLSLLHYFPATDIVKNDIDPSDIAVLGGVALVVTLLAILRFRHRNIA